MEAKVLDPGTLSAASVALAQLSYVAVDGSQGHWVVSVSLFGGLKINKPKVFFLKSGTDLCM